MNEINTTRHHAKFLDSLAFFIILEAIGNPGKTIARSVGGRSRKIKILEALKEGDFFAPSRLGSVD